MINPLTLGAEVTVNGEISGDTKVNFASFWGEIVQIDNGEEYTTADNVGVKHKVQRHQIRHRVWKVICCAGVSDDHSHDRFANDNFGKLERKWITEQTTICYLAQHFKSTGAMMEAYAALWYVQVNGATSLSTYHFGCPGHGKGP